MLSSSLRRIVFFGNHVHIGGAPIPASLSRQPLRFAKSQAAARGSPKSRKLFRALMNQVSSGPKGSVQGEPFAGGLGKFQEPRFVQALRAKAQEELSRTPKTGGKEKSESEAKRVGRETKVSS